MFFKFFKRPKPKKTDSITLRETPESRVLNKKMGRRSALRSLSSGLVAGASIAQSACTPFGDSNGAELAKLQWDEYFKNNFRVMTDQEKQDSIDRLTQLHQAKTKQNLHLKATSARPGVLFGYAFNISKCRGYMDCVQACIQENNQDRSSKMAYIKIFEAQKGSMNLEAASSTFFHEVPAEGHFYFGTQCFQCENPPCVQVCPVQATWKEPDGIVVIDYDWCIGCRYCEAACPYWARRFNWGTPQIPKAEVNPNQHYLGNRLRKKGVMEKCTFCIQRTREGRNPACVEACPTGARIFGNLLDPDSDIRWVLSNKKVFRLKEELGTEPKFWYFMD